MSNSSIFSSHFLQLWSFSPCNKRETIEREKRLHGAQQQPRKNQSLLCRDLTRSDHWRKKVLFPRQLGIFMRKIWWPASSHDAWLRRCIVEVDAGEKSVFWCPEFICVIFRDVFLWEISLLCTLIQCLNEKNFDGQVKFQRILSICGNEFNQMTGYNNYLERKIRMPDEPATVAPSKNESHGW